MEYIFWMIGILHKIVGDFWYQVLSSCYLEWETYIFFHTYYFKVGLSMGRTCKTNIFLQLIGDIQILTEMALIYQTQLEIKRENRFFHTYSPFLRSNIFYVVFKSLAISSVIVYFSLGTNYLLQMGGYYVHTKFTIRRIYYEIWKRNSIRIAWTKLLLRQ